MKGEGGRGTVQPDCNTLEESSTQTFTKKFQETGSQTEVVQMVGMRKTENEASNQKGEIPILNETNKLVVNQQETTHTEKTLTHVDEVIKSLGFEKYLQYEKVFQHREMWLTWLRKKYIEEIKDVTRAVNDVMYGY